jgi:hypothetical protein
MAVISRTTASLRYFGDDLNPDDLTTSLGREPTSSETKGQAIVGKNTGRVRIAKTGGWRLRAEDREPGDLDAQIQELFGSLTADLSIWRELAVKYRPDLFVGFFMKKGNEGIEISAESLGILSSRGVSLSLDIYDPVDDG